jgi:copper resistance protein B
MNRALLFASLVLSGPSVAQDLPAPVAAAHDPDCPPEHAKMGHCTPKVASTAPAAPGAVETNLPLGTAPAPAPPKDWYADRLFPGGAMQRSRDAMMKENGGQTFGFVAIDIFEAQPRRGRDAFRWDAEAWYGGDVHRLTLKIEGEGHFGDGIEHAEIQALYSRAIDPYFNLQAGVRQDVGRGPHRTYATIGVEGLAPYWFDVAGTLFVSDKGDVLARLEGHYDQRITQRLILQPRAEITLAAQDMPANGIGAGLSEIELGLRLRYEIVREFAPYIGLSWSAKVGSSAHYARAIRSDTSGLGVVVGIRMWL